MELTAEQKKTMIEQRLQMYQQQIFSLQMDRIALEAVDDHDGIKSIDKRIEALQKAHTAVQGMILNADS